MATVYTVPDYYSNRPYVSLISRLISAELCFWRKLRRRYSFYLIPPNVARAGAEFPH